MGFTFSLVWRIISNVFWEKDYQLELHFQNQTMQEDHHCGQLLLLLVVPFLPTIFNKNKFVLQCAYKTRLRRLWLCLVLLKSRTTTFASNLAAQQQSLFLAQKANNLFLLGWLGLSCLAWFVLFGLSRLVGFVTLGLSCLVWFDGSHIRWVSYLVGLIFGGSRNWWILYLVALVLGGSRNQYSVGLVFGRSHIWWVLYSVALVLGGSCTILGGSHIQWVLWLSQWSISLPQMEWLCGKSTFESVVLLYWWYNHHNCQNCFNCDKSSNEKNEAAKMRRQKESRRTIF